MILHSYLFLLHLECYGDNPCNGFNLLAKEDRVHSHLVAIVTACQYWLLQLSLTTNFSIILD